jgi:putative peptidoglycan lipid II flippase
VDRFPLAVDLVRIAFPMAAVLVLSAGALGVLNSHRRFFLPYFAPVLWNAAMIGALWWWASRAAGGGVDDASKTRLLYVVMWAALAGAGLQLAVQIPSVARLLPGFRLSASRRVPGVPEALRAFGPAVAGRGVVQLSGYLDAFLATLLAAGAVSAQRFASTLYMLPVSLFAMSVAAAELPELARLPAEGDEARLRRADSGLRQIAFLTVPTLVGFLAFGWLVVGLVYVGREFGAADQALVTLVLAGYTLGLLPTTFGRLLQNLYYSLHETKYPARVATARVAVSAALGAAAMIWLDRYGVGRFLGAAEQGELRLGAVGLALGSAVGGWVELTLLLRGLRARLSHAGLPWPAIGRMAGLAVASAVMAGGLWWAFVHSPLSAAPGWAAALAVLGVYAACYLGSAALLGFPEMKTWLGRLR